MSDRAKGEEAGSQGEVSRKLKAVCEAAAHSFPSGEIEEMLAEIESDQEIVDLADPGTNCQTNPSGTNDSRQSPGGVLRQ